MRRLFLLSLVLACLAVPAHAGTWAGPNNTGIQTFCTSNGVDELLIEYEYEPITGRPTWQGAFAPCSPTTFDALTFIARGGQVFGGAYRAPTVTFNVKPISLKFFTPLAGNLAEGERAVKRTPGEEGSIQVLTRIELETGRPKPAALADYIGWWVVPNELGIGVSLDIQGTTAFMGVYTYTADGLDDWFISTGPLTTATTFEQDLQHCDKATGVVACTPRGKLRFAAFYQNNDTRHPRLTLTLPSGEAKILHPYTR